MEHERLSIEIDRGLLIRHVAGSRHRVFSRGGGFAFSAAFWQAHRADFDRLQIADRISGEIFYCEGAALEKVERVTLSEKAGPQILVPLSVFERTRSRPTITREPITAAPAPAAGPEQLGLL